MMSGDLVVRRPLVDPRPGVGRAGSPPIGGVFGYVGSRSSSTTAFAATMIAVITDMPLMSNR